MPNIFRLKIAQLALFAALILALMPAPASARFGDCSARDYLEGFGYPVNAGVAGTIDCVEAFNIGYDTPGGPRRIRAIHDISVGWLVSDGSIAALEEGARRAIETLALIGDYRVHDVTIMVLEDIAGGFGGPEDDDFRAMAVASTYWDDATGEAECLITFFALEAEAMDPEFVGYFMAHELFHCVQNASLSQEQIATMTGNGAWWAEGSAEYFASLAMPDRGDLIGRALDFADAVVAGTPLHDLNYAMAVFFWWFHAEYGPTGLIPFLRQMAGSSEVAAQRAAMRTALAPQDWLRFAEAYADRAIRHPGGSEIAYSDEDPPQWIFMEDRAEPLRLRPFVLVLGDARYNCGLWFNEGATDEEAIGAREAWDGAWGAYPGDVDTRDGGADSYRVAALHAGDEMLNTEIRVERRGSCAPCGGTDAIDACLVGIWNFAGGGAIERMRAMGIPITSAMVTPGPVMYSGNGSYVTLPMGADITVTYPDAIGEGTGATFGSTGRWSAADGVLNLCEETGGMSGTVTITDEHGTRSGPVAVPGGGVMLTMRYSCSEAGHETSHDIPGFGTIVTQFARAVPPEEPEAPEEPEPGESRPRQGSDLIGAGGCPLEDPDPEVEDACDRLRRAFP